MGLFFFSVLSSTIMQGFNNPYSTKFVHSKFSPDLFKATNLTVIPFSWDSNSTLSRQSKRSRLHSDKRSAGKKIVGTGICRDKSIFKPSLCKLLYTYFAGMNFCPNRKHFPANPLPERNPNIPDYPPSAELISYKNELTLLSCPLLAVGPPTPTSL